MVKVTTLALFASAFLLLIIPLLIFPSYSQTNVNNTNPLDQDNVSITGDRSHPSTMLPTYLSFSNLSGVHSGQEMINFDVHTMWLSIQRDSFT